MPKLLKWLLLVTLTLVGLAWSLLQTLFELLPGTALRTDVPFEPDTAEHTWDGKTIID